MRELTFLASVLAISCSAAMPQERRFVIVEGTHCPILHQTSFAHGSAALEADTLAMLDATALVVTRDPDTFVLIEVAGHAAEGEDDSLAQARAAASLDALVARGVPRERLRARGYGALCPVDPERTAEARARNRRVEFKIVATRDGPTGVELDCPNAMGAPPSATKASER